MVGPTLPDRASEDDYRTFFTALSQVGADALFVDGSPEHITKRQLIVELASNSRLPSHIIHFVRSSKSVVSWPMELTWRILRQAARSIDKVLKGANPGDIPFYQPTKFELVINLQAAKALGLTVPPSVLTLADELE